MPFDIGRPFSDSALALLQRRREADAQNALALQKLQLDAEQQSAAEQASNRALALQEMRGNQESDRLTRQQDFEERKFGAEADLRRALASANHELGYAQLGELTRHHGAQEQTDEDRAREMAQYHGGLLDIGEFNALTGADRAESDRRRTAEEEAMGGYRRDVLGPSQVAANEALAGLRGAQTGQAEANTELTRERASEMRKTFGLRTVGDFEMKITRLINAYNAAAGNPNGPNKEAMDYAKTGIQTLLNIAQASGDIDLDSLHRHIQVTSHQTPFGQATAGPFSPTGQGYLPGEAKNALAQRLGLAAPASAPQEPAASPNALTPPGMPSGPPDETKTLPDGTVYARWGDRWVMVPKGVQMPGKPPPTTGR